MLDRKLLVLALVIAGVLGAAVMWSGPVRPTFVPCSRPALSETPEARVAENVQSAEPGLAETVAPVVERTALAPPAATESSAPSSATTIAPTATLVVLAVDKKSRAPMAGVRMSVHVAAPEYFAFSTPSTESKGSMEISPVTSTDGRVEFELPVGVDLGLSASREDREGSDVQSAVPKLTAGETRELLVEITTGNDLHYFGRVLARADTRPIQSAKIELIRGEQELGWENGEETEHTTETRLANTETDSEGLFELWLPSWKEPDIRVQAAGFTVAFVQPGPEHDSPESAGVITLTKGASVRARLFDERGAALAGGEVRLRTSAYELGVAHHREIYFPSIDEVEWRSNADSSGLCEFEDLPTDVPLQVEILRDGRIVERDVPQIALAPGEARDVEWKLSAGCRLKGFVVDQHDEVVAGRELWLQRADHDGRTFFEDYAEDVAHKAVTDKDGRFAFDSVNQGKWWVGPSAEPDASGASDPTAIAPVAEIVEIRDGTVEHEVRLRVHRGLYIRGQVLDPKGEPAAKVYIHASTDVAAWLVLARTDKAGAFALGPLVPGRYSLVAKGWTHADSKPVVANAGDSGVDLHLEAGGSLIGAVVDGSTGKASAAMLTFSRRGDIERGIEMSDSGDDGTFRLEGLASGLYDVVAVSSGQRVGVLRELTVQGGVESSGLVVTLAPGALLRVKYAGTDESMGCRVSEGDTTIAGGGMLFGGSQELVVPAGHLMLECGSTSGWSETRTIDLTVGQVLEVAVGGK